MANVSIPNLPSQTATTDLDLLVITDSGETTTSKITKDTLLRTSFTYGARNTPAINGTNSVIVGGEDHTITNASNFAGIFAGDSNDITGADYGAIIGGRSNTASSGADSVCIGGFNNTMLANQGGMLGSYSCRISSSGSVSVGSNGSKAEGYYAGVYGAISCENDALISAIIACQDTDMIQGRFSFAAGDYNTFAFNDYEGNDTTHVLSLSNDTTAIRLNSSAVNSGATMMIGSMNSWIGKTSTTTADIKRSSIYGSLNSHISSSGGTHSGNMILSSTNTAIENKNRVVAINVDGYTADTENVVVVPQLVMTEYSSLNYSGDTAAAAGGVVLGGLYHDNGALRVRIA